MEKFNIANSKQKERSAGASVPALRRAVAILDYISDSCGDVFAADICRNLAIPKSTAHGLLEAMEELDLLRRDPAGSIAVGPRALQWSNSFLANSDLVSAFRQCFSRNNQLGAYTITMTVLEGAEVVYIACSQANQPLGVTFRIGMRLPAPFTATGKALLAGLSEAELEARLAEGFPAPLTQYSVRNLAELKRGLAQVEERGFSIDDGEVREGMICLGARMRDHEGRSVAGLALSLTRPEATPEKMQELGEQLNHAALEISALLGGR